MKYFNAVLIFAAGFALGNAIAKKDIDRKCNEIVEKELDAFRAFREENEKKKEEKETPEDDTDDNAEIINDVLEDEGTAEKIIKKAIQRESIVTNIPEDEETAGRIIKKAEYGLLGYDMVKLELFADMTVEDTYGNVIRDPEGLLGIEDLNDLYDSDDQTSAFVQNDETQTYYEVIREV